MLEKKCSVLTAYHSSHFWGLHRPITLMQYLNSSYILLWSATDELKNLTQSKYLKLYIEAYYFHGNKPYKPFKTSKLEAVSKPASFLVSSGMLSSWCCGSDRASLVSFGWPCRPCSRLLDVSWPVSLAGADEGSLTDWWVVCWQQWHRVEWYSVLPASTCWIACLALSRCLCHQQQAIYSVSQ